MPAPQRHKPSAIPCSVPIRAVGGVMHLRLLEGFPRFLLNFRSGFGPHVVSFLTANPCSCSRIRKTRKGEREKKKKGRTHLERDLDALLYHA